MKKILLTGGTGFIGRNLKESYLKDKYELYAPTRAELNTADTASVDAYFQKHEFDVVLHGAVKPGHRNAPDHSQLFYTNVRMFENIARHSDRFGKFINFGSGAVYDASQNNSGVTEEQLFTHLGADEHSFCKYVVAKRIESLPRFIDLNIFGIFGKYEDYAIRFISNAICKSLFGLPITLRQNRRFSYLDVDDLPAILESFIEKDVEFSSYNVVPDGFAELRSIAEYVASKNGSEVLVASEGYGLDYYGSNARLRKEFPDVKFTPIMESIDRLYDWYEANKDSLNSEVLRSDR